MFFKTTYTDKTIKIVLKETYLSEFRYGIKKTLSFDIKLCHSNISIGYIDLRVGESPYLYYMGNIGYRIEDKYRGHNFAQRAVELIKKQAIKEKMERLIITCSPNNLASYHTCVNLKAKLLEKTIVPDWHELYKRGETEKCIFEIKLKGENDEG